MKKYCSTLAGNVMSFYDFILFGYLSRYMSLHFFPNEGEFVSELLTFSLFASACLIRPIGAIVYGYIGDTQGRKKALLMSIILSSFATFSVGFLPTYKSLGIGAAVLLVLLRLLQGFSVSGEETGAAIYLSEQSTKQKFFSGSLILSSVYVGLFLGSLTCLLIISIVGDENMSAWGWRVPFILSGLIGFASILSRVKSVESVVFDRYCLDNNINKKPITSLIMSHKLQILIYSLLCSLLGITIYLFAVYLPQKINLLVKSSIDSSIIITSGIFLVAMLCPVFGLISDKIGGARMMKFGIGGFILFSYYSLSLMGTGNIQNIILGYIIFGVCLSMVAAPLFGLFVNKFKANVRYSGVSMSFNLSMTLFGSTAPIIALAIEHYFHSLSYISFYIMIACCLALFALLKLDGLSQQGVEISKGDNHVRV